MNKTAHNLSSTQKKRKKARGKKTQNISVNAKSFQGWTEVSLFQ